MSTTVRAATKRTLQRWSDADIAALIELAPSCTWQQVAAYLGRGESACKEKARAVRRSGVSVQKLPGATQSIPFYIPAGLPLVAKTCPLCGVLRDGSQFTRNNNGGKSYRTSCRHCDTKSFLSSQRYKKYRQNADVLNKATAAQADNANLPYSEADDRVIRDTSLSAFEVALKIGRTYYAISNRRNALGIHVRGAQVRCADDLARWEIHFPQAMAAVREHFRAIGKPVPEGFWDWNDEAVA